MPVTPVKIPENLVQFVNGSRRADLVKAEQLLNAFQNLRVQVTIAGSTRIVVGSIQISGESAILEIKL